MLLQTNKYYCAFNNNYIEYESRGDKNKNLSLEDYFYIIRPYLRGMINKNGEWKNQLTMQINFISLETGEFRTMHSKSNNAEIMMGTETDDTINEFFESFLEKYQMGLETKMKGSQFAFESVNLLYHSLHKISLNRGGSYIDSREWLKNKRATTNPPNKDNECFKYAITVALNHERIKKDPQRISKIKPFIDQYNWNGIEFPSHLKDWKKFK